jgi:hypothetical protein
LAKIWSKWHGYGGGPKTKEGRARCAAAKTIHGRETRQIRAERTAKLAELHELETLGREIGLIKGPKTPGRKPYINKTSAGLIVDFEVDSRD